MTPLSISQAFDFCIPLNKLLVVSTCKTQLLTFPYFSDPQLTVDYNAGRNVRDSALLYFGGENEHHQKFKRSGKRFYSNSVSNEVWLRNPVGLGSKVKILDINIPEHVGKGASHSPLSKHLSSLCPSNAKSLVQANCSLCPIFIFLLACGSPATRR